MISRRLTRPDEAGRFGEYGGRFAPETLMPALSELEKEFGSAWNDPPFRGELDRWLAEYVGRPTPLQTAGRLSAELGVEVLLKREDLAHTGAHKINN
ncbi:MAG: tryptophan synthase subunit beta, partial [Acidimicrobiia bacterium]